MRNIGTPGTPGRLARRRLQAHVYVPPYNPVIASFVESPVLSVLGSRNGGHNHIYPSPPPSLAAYEVFIPRFELPSALQPETLYISSFAHSPTGLGPPYPSSSCHRLLCSVTLGAALLDTKSYHFLAVSYVITIIDFPGIVLSSPDTPGLPSDVGNDTLVPQCPTPG